MDFFAKTLFTVGLASVLGAIVGGGLKAFGIELPLLASRVRQVLLGVVGAGMIGLALLLGVRSGPAAPAGPSPADAAKPFAVSPAPERAAVATPAVPPAAAPAVAQASPSPAPVTKGQGPGCPNPDRALDCLPPSSRPVVFADPAAANAVAWANVKEGLSTSQGTAASIFRGANGRAARLCGILQSNDSSPLALHLAAVKLQGAGGSLGAVDGVCAALIPKLL